MSGEDGEFDAAPLISVERVRGHKEPRSRYSASQIEEIARAFQTEIWHKRASLLGSEDVNPLEVTNIEAAFDAIDFEFQSNSSLGVTADSDVAGYIDADRKIAAVSEHLPLELQRFTAAHELGHALLHKADGLHRERPQQGRQAVKRPSIEAEADLFAAVFLMPHKVVYREFVKRFKTEAFELNENNVYGLFGNNDMAATRSTRQLSLLLADATRFHNLTFTSLREVFKLSAPSVAIRLENLGLVAS